MRTISIRPSEASRAARRLHLSSVGVLALALAAGCGDQAQLSSPVAKNHPMTTGDDGTNPGASAGSTLQPVESDDAGTGGSPNDPGSSSDAGTGDASIDPSGSGSGGAGDDAGDGGDWNQADGGSMAAPGSCNATTPHGCYAIQPGSNPMCPAQSPEQSASYPPFAEWKGCNGIQPAVPFALDPKSTCTYKGPQGQAASCICDSGFHWICLCTAAGVGGTGVWPNCMP